MTYEVIWQSVAESELTEVWLQADDRNLVTEAAAWLDVQLSRNPLTLGESRDASIHRIAFREPIGIEFEVIEDDKRVIVQAVFTLT